MPATDSFVHSFAYLVKYFIGDIFKMPSKARVKALGILMAINHGWVTPVS